MIISVIKTVFTECSFLQTRRKIFLPFTNQKKRAFYAVRPTSLKTIQANVFFSQINIVFHSTVPSLLSKTSEKGCNREDCCQQRRIRNREFCS